jgi:rSAM/selenodomain-associated transferase 2
MQQSVSIIIPVFHEAERIDRTLAALEASIHPDAAEIILVDGSPEKDTVRAVRRPGVRGIIAPTGRGIQMNRGAAAAKGDILIFLHADTRLPPGAVSRVRTALGGRGIAAGAFDLAIDSRKRVFRLIERGANLRSRITRMPYGDQAIFIRKDFFTRIGGFPEIPVMEDVDLMRRVKRNGGRIRILEAPATTSPRRWEKEGAFYCTLRNWALVLLFLSGFSPFRLARFYR